VRVRTVGKRLVVERDAEAAAAPPPQQRKEQRRAHSAEEEAADYAAGQLHVVSATGAKDRDKRTTEPRACTSPELKRFGSSVVAGPGTDGCAVM
jgi:hypothetical protein